jgi:hypothetical protein
MLDMAPEALRKRLQRARERLTLAMEEDSMSERTKVG